MGWVVLSLEWGEGPLGGGGVGVAGWQPRLRDIMVALLPCREEGRVGLQPLPVGGQRGAHRAHAVQGARGGAQAGPDAEHPG